MTVGQTFQKASKWGEKRRKTEGSARRCDPGVRSVRTPFLLLAFRPCILPLLRSSPLTLPCFFEVCQLVVIVALPGPARPRIGLKRVPTVDQFLLDQFLNTLSDCRFADPEFAGNRTFAGPTLPVCPGTMHEVEIDEKGIAG